MLEYLVLGPVEVWREGRPVAVGGPKPRTALAALLVHAGEVVSTEALIDHLWGDDPPAASRNLVHGCVSRLRSALGAPAIERCPPGYRMRVGAGELDAGRFDRLARAGEEALAAGDAHAAASLLQEALRLWRGPALGGVCSERLVETAGAALEERRLQALETRIEADLELGHHHELLGELRALVAEHPLRPGLRSRLMVALHRCGRRADALAAYEAGRRALAEDLGIGPDPELRRLAERIRADDPSLDAPDQAPAAAPGGAPRHLPPGISDFTGRRAELTRVCGALSRASGRRWPVCFITGPAGVGKTTLAIRAAHRLRPRFPDGQLFADLGGGAGGPVPPETVLAQLLQALGVDGTAIPADLGRRADLYRARLIDSRVLVVLDNAVDEAQVRPLLPSGTGCAAVVTSRSPLRGLEAARTVALGVLQADESIELLARVAGPARIAAEPRAAGVIAGLCGHLPLAIRIAGARLASRPNRRLASFAERLEDEHRRLDELRAGDLEVRASLAVSYRALEPAARLAFRILALAPGPDLAAWLGAALLDVEVPACEALLERLVDVHLLEVLGEDAAGQTRYRFHGLVRLLALELSAVDGESVRRQAVERAVGAQLALTERAHAALSPGNAGHRDECAAVRWLPQPDRAIAAVREHPLDWFEAERASLVAGVEVAARHGFAEAAWALACGLTTFFGIRGHWQDWQATHEQAAAAARAAGLALGEANAVEMLGVCHLWLGDVRRALPCFERSLELARAVGSARRVATGQYGLGLVAAYRGDCQRAEELLNESLAHFRGAGDQHGVAVTLDALAEAQRLGGRRAEATANLGLAGAIFHASGDLHWEAISLLSLADLHRAEGRLEQADACLARCLALFQGFGNRHFAALALNRLARVRVAQGRRDEAVACLRRCTVAFAELGLRLAEARALHRMGRIQAELGDGAAAGTAFERALAAFRDLGAADVPEVEADLGGLVVRGFKKTSRTRC